MSKITVVSFCFNTPEEVENATRMLYEQNDSRDFQHYLISLDFPITEGDVIPDSFAISKHEHYNELIRIANTYGSVLCKAINIGVSQNHQNFIDFIKPTDDDVICTCDTDEIAMEGGWVKALADVLRADETIGYAAPILTDAIPILQNNPMAESAVIDGKDVYIMKGNMNYSQIAYSGRFLNKIGNIPYPANMEIYGGLEEMLQRRLKEFGMKWVILKDYTTVHTNNVKLLREWKDAIIYRSKDFGGKQIGFEEWLVLKKWGKL